MFNNVENYLQNASTKELVKELEKRGCKVGSCDFSSDIILYTKGEEPVEMRGGSNEHTIIIVDRYKHE